jgi:hypothetical protein
MFGSSHTTSVRPARGGRKYQYVCSCGATGYETASLHTAQQMGAQHKVNANKKGRR